MIDLAATIAKMKLCGMSAEQIVMALECLIATDTPEPSAKAIDEAAERRRAADRERKAAKREEDRLRKSAEVCGQSEEAPSPLVPPSLPAPSLPPIIPPSRVDAGASERRVSRATRLPEDFRPLPAVIEFARNLGFTDADVKFEIEQFTDYWRSVPGQRGTKLDWQATLRNRFRDVHSKRKSSPGNFRKPSPADQMRDAFADLRADFAGARSVAGHREFDGS
jgi:hypothetical protein